MPPYRPPQWSQSVQLYGISEPYPYADSPTLYFFDAVLRAEHVQELAITRHPVQIATASSAPGGSISDHAYMLPARVTLEIGMSDALDRYNPTDYTSTVSKSVSAYQTLLTVQARRNPLVLLTRLQTYSNMLIQSIRPIEDYKTRHALRAHVIFEQILMGLMFAAPVSALPQLTESSPQGEVQPTPAADWVSGYQIAPLAAAPTTAPEPQDYIQRRIQNRTVPGSGDFSSSPLGDYSVLMGTD